MTQEVRALNAGVRPGSEGWISFGARGWVHVEVERVTPRGIAVLKTLDRGERNKRIRRPWADVVVGAVHPDKREAASVEQGQMDLSIPKGQLKPNQWRGFVSGRERIGHYTGRMIGGHREVELV